MGSGAYLHCNKCVAQGKLKDVCVPSSAGAPRVENSSKSRQDFLAAPGYGAGRKGRHPTGGMVLKHRCVSKDTEKWGKGTYGQLADRGTREELVPAVASCNRKSFLKQLWVDFLCTWDLTEGIMLARHTLFHWATVQTLTYAKLWPWCKHYNKISH